MNMRRHTKTAGIYFLGIFFIVVGLVGLALPFLQGVLFIVVGVVLLSLRVPGGHRVLSWIGRIHPKVATLVDKIERWANGAGKGVQDRYNESQRNADKKEDPMGKPKCDNKSVGILIFRNGKLLLIDRKRPPFGLAAPAGHVDDHGARTQPEEEKFKSAAVEETKEEVGLSVNRLTLVFEGRKNNPCRRPGGGWHYWRVYNAEAKGEVEPSAEETRGHFWCTHKQMKELLDGGALVVPAHGEERVLEPVWCELFQEIDILRYFPSNHA